MLIAQGVPLILVPFDFTPWKRNGEVLQQVESTWVVKVEVGANDVSISRNFGKRFQVILLSFWLGFNDFTKTLNGCLGTDKLIDKTNGSIRKQGQVAIHAVKRQQHSNS
ncbi:hypothetical protein Ple7327_2906 [Pleurocapsa sp. PCC 7327]|nr:hypothetical protein Ple7327_2906 [Pleurocapsa sp. PCC 7327]